MLKIKYLMLVVLLKKQITALKYQVLMIKLIKSILIQKTLQKLFFLLFWGNVMFNNEDGILAYLIFQPLYKYFKTITNTNYILSWKSKGLSAESINHLQHLIIVLPQN